MSPAPPRAADIVVIGAGAIGAGIAYHLSRRGARDVVVLERDFVGAGSTSKAAGGIRVQFGTRVEIEFSQRGIAFFKRFEDEMGVPCDFHQEGYLFVVTDEATLARFRTNVTLQQSLGADVRIIAPDDARALVPSLVVDDAVAAVWGPTDGYASPNDVVQAYAARARAGGVRILEETPVTGLRVGELLRCPWHGWEFDMRNGQSWFDPKRVKVRSYPVAVESGEDLQKGPYVAETFPVHVEDSYVIIET